MEIKNINLRKKDFKTYFLNRHIRDWSIVSLPLLVIMMITAFIARIVSVGFDFVSACYLITILVAFLYFYSINKLSKSYENKPFDLFLDKGIYQMKRKNENNRLVVTFKKDLKEFLYYDENEQYFYLFPEKTTTFVLPKNIFNDEDKKYFTAQITKKMTKRKTPWVKRVFHAILAVSAICFTIFFIVGIFR